MAWTAMERDGWVADYRIREVEADLLPRRVEGRWAWPGMTYYALEARYPLIAQPITRPFDLVGRHFGEWVHIRAAWTREALRD